MKILAIETSCDETAAAVVDYTDGVFDVRANVVSSQVALHAKFGGVVPNLAAREHEKNILPVITEALAQAGATPDALDLITVTHGPGLIPALVIGTSAAKTLAYKWHKPLIGVHHIEGHIYANAISLPGGTADMQFPLIALVVSGGHTQLVLMRDHVQYEIIGETLDDAVGEAFDKAARMLGLAYPGGPAISKAAEKHNTSLTDVAPLPRPMIHSGDFNFSFSGIKTAVLYRIKDFLKEHGLTDDAPLPEEFVHAMSYEFQEAVTEVLVKKTLKAVKEYGAHTVTIAGGVSANTRLRARLGNALADKYPETQYMIPQFDYCLDNAAMIAAAAAIHYERMTPTERAAARDAYRTLDASATLKMTT